MRLGLGLGLARSTGGGGGPVTIGGVAIGEAGTGIYSGYTLFDGDDFNGSLNIIGPSTPRGKYATTRGAYVIPEAGQYPRGSSGLGNYDVDPQHTGYLDSNRGVAVPGFSDSITVSGGALTLKLREKTGADATHMADMAKTGIGAMIHTGLATLGRAPVIFEWREKRTAQIWSHITSWLMQANGYATDEDLELDFPEAQSEPGGGGDGRDIQYNVNAWTAGVRSGSPGSIEALAADTYVTFTAVINVTGDVFCYRDGVLKRTYVDNRAKALARSFYILFTAHMYQAATALSTPATQTIDWWRVWGVTAHFRPLTAGATYQTDFGVAGSWTLPDKLTTWGDAGVTEVVEACMMETNEPGGTSNGVTYAALPTNWSYNTGTRQLAVTSGETKPGRLYISRYVNQAGCTCNPQIILAEIGPKITIATQAWTVGSPVNLDIYAACDVGNILPKILSVTGLPAGLSFSSSTGLVTGTPSSASSGTVVVTCTNSSAQAATANVSYTVSAAVSSIPAPTLTGSPTLLASWDFADNSKLTTSSGKIDQITGSDGTSRTLASTGSNRPTLTTSGGNQVAQFVAANTEYLTGAHASGLTAGCTMVVVFEPDSTGITQGLLEISDGGAFVNNRRVMLTSATNGYQARKHDGSGNQAIAQMGSAFGTGRRLLIGVMPTGNVNSELYIDGTATPLVSATTANNGSGWNVTTMGATNELGSFLRPCNGKVARVLIYDGALNSTQREEVAVWSNTNFATANNA